MQRQSPGARGLSPLAQRARRIAADASRRKTEKRVSAPTPDGVTKSLGRPRTAEDRGGPSPQAMLVRRAFRRPAPNGHRPVAGRLCKAVQRPAVVGRAHEGCTKRFFRTIQIARTQAHGAEGLAHRVVPERRLRIRELILGDDRLLERCRRAREVALRLRDARIDHMARYPQHFLCRHTAAVKAAKSAVSSSVRWPPTPLARCRVSPVAANATPRA